MEESNKIIVYSKESKIGVLELAEYGIKTKAYLGKNGTTANKKEGDGKTPIGEFKLGTILGTHPKEKIANNNYKQITKNMYWVDDINSKYYNKLVDITNVNKNWNSAEHLIQYPIQYEYLIEIKTNPLNIPGKGSAIFLHCENNKQTEGCIAISRNAMQKLINVVNSETKIKII